jgi:hypothetical protein
MKSVFAVVLFIIGFCIGSSVAIADNADTALINSFISKQAEREKGEEYEDARKILAGDLNRDRAPDLAVLYTIEGQDGTNTHVQYLAVFIRMKGRLLPATYTAVGGKSRRSVELKSIKNNVILLNTLNYTPDDAACCPSKKGSARYVLANKKLKEL